MTITRRQSRQARRAARTQAAELQHDLAGYTSQAERLELSAMLARYDDTQTAEIRALIDLTAAA